MFGFVIKVGLVGTTVGALIIAYVGSILLWDLVLRNCIINLLAHELRESTTFLSVFSVELMWTEISAIILGLVSLMFCVLCSPRSVKYSLTVRNCVGASCFCSLSRCRTAG